MPGAESSKGPGLIGPLRDILKELYANPYPEVENPDGCKKRASVALVLRVRPSYEQEPSVSEPSNTSDSTTEHLDRFFAQSWIQHGDPECVFIKRAARTGDRWTSHVALPGGKRGIIPKPLGHYDSNEKSDKEDENDKAVAVRETSEEIGLDLTSPHALFIGNLPERVVSTSFGRQPIMVLCPFVWLWTGPDIPPFKLQPTEVASTHWVPLRVLLAPSARTHEYVDVSDRFAHRGSTFLKAIIRSILGKMRFSAIRLTPSESLYCSSTAEFFSTPEENPSTTTKASLASRLYNWYLGDHAGAAGNNRPLLLWGLTLGMLADFLDQLPPYNAVELWSYPTFTSWNVRFIIDILTIPLKRRNQARLRNSGMKNETAIDSETEAVTADNPWFIGGLSKGMEASKKGKFATRSYAVGILLEDYYAMARRGVWISAGIRAATTVLFALYIVRRYRQQISR